jgi:hypothetical protein
VGTHTYIHTRTYIHAHTYTHRSRDRKSRRSRSGQGTDTRSHRWHTDSRMCSCMYARSHRAHPAVNVSDADVLYVVYVCMRVRRMFLRWSMQAFRYSWMVESVYVCIVYTSYSRRARIHTPHATGICMRTVSLKHILGSGQAIDPKLVSEALRWARCDRAYMQLHIRLSVCLL